MAGTDQQDQGPAATVEELVDLRRQPTAGAADAVTNRLVIQAGEALSRLLSCADGGPSTPTGASR